MRFTIKSEELVRLVAAPVKGLVSTYTYRYITETCRHTTDIQYLHIKQTTCTAAGTLQVVGITTIVSAYHVNKKFAHLNK